MKSTKKLIATIIASASILVSTPFNTINQAIVVEAHSGRTDSNGGHRDNKNVSGLGSYHYHHGYPAHLHTGGVCPYTSSVATTSYSSSSSNRSSGSSSSSGSSIISTSGKTINLSSGGTASISNDLIKIIQDVLNQKGYDCGNPDGIIGDKTKNALKDFLSDNSGDENTDYLIISMIAESLNIS